MNRRTFIDSLLKTGAVGWVAHGWLLADETQTSYTLPVPLATSPAQVGLDPTTLDALFTINAGFTSEQQAQIFPQSVAAGDPTPSGIILWTRVDPQYQTSGDQLAWQIATDSNFTTVLAAGTTTLTTANDNTAKLPISAPGVLQPFATYYYRFIYNNVPSRTGRFKTLPLPSDSPAALNFAFIVCQDYGNGFYTALTHLAQEQVDYVIHLGDYIYESIASNFQGNPARTVPTFPSGPNNTIAVDVNDYRHLYKIYRSDPNLQAVHENFAVIQLWDDHEFANDSHQDFHPDNNPAGVTADTPQPQLRQAANQAWSEYGLADVTFDPADDNWETSIQIYRKFSFGTLADLIVTDERLYRDGPPCGSNQLFQRYFSAGCSEIQNPNRTMLGTAQRSWFLNQMTGSPAVWKFWANEVMLMQLKLAGFIYIDLDQWDGYGKERQSLLNTIKTAGVNNFVALTGDLHTFLAGYLKPTFDDLFASPMGVEFMVGSVTSANLAEGIESAVDLPSCPLPAKQFRVPPNALEPLIRFNNPHIQYWDSSTHGYALLAVTSAQLVCTYKAVTTVRAPTAGIVTLRTFAVPAGKVQLKQF
jgi:alkaline phosphatase D